MFIIRHLQIFQFEITHEELMKANKLTQLMECLEKCDPVSDIMFHLYQNK